MVAAGDYDTKLNLLIASGDLPDIFALPSNYAGGVDKAFKDGLIADIGQYWNDAPALKKVLESNPRVDEVLQK